jgi:hypothetical protein
MAGRILKDAAPDTRSRAEHGFRLCASRKPTPAEIDRLLTWLSNEQRNFSAHPAEAAKLAHDRPAGVGATDSEFAAWTMLSNVLLNLDETLTKE